MTHGHGNIGNIDRPDLVGKDYSVVSEEIGKAERLQLFRIIVRGLGTASPIWQKHP